MTKDMIQSMSKKELRHRLNVLYGNEALKPKFNPKKSLVDLAAWNRIIK